MCMKINAKGVQTISHKNRNCVIDMTINIQFPTILYVYLPFYVSAMLHCNLHNTYTTTFNLLHRIFKLKIEGERTEIFRIVCVHICSKLESAVLWNAKSHRVDIALGRTDQSGKRRGPRARTLEGPAVFLTKIYTTMRRQRR